MRLGWVIELLVLSMLLLDVVGFSYWMCRVQDACDQAIIRDTKS